MSRFKNYLVFLSLFIFVLASSTYKAYADPSILRLAGNDRYETSQKTSQDGWSKSDYAVLVSGKSYADGLSAAPLAKKYNAPILLTDDSSLSSSTIQEIQRLGVNNVFIIGGPTVISDTVENQLESLNINSTRTYGQDRYETSVKIAKIIGSDNGVFITSGENFPDALSVSSIAAIKQMPVLFTSSKVLPSSVKEYITNSNINKYYVVGGIGAIGDNVVKDLPNFKRLSGSNRYETNLSVLNEFINDLNLNNIYLASGQNFPDALGASAAAAKNTAPVILTDGYYSNTTNFIKSKINSISTIKVLGGISIIPNSLVRRILSDSKIVLGYSTYYNSNDAASYNSLVNYSRYIDEIATDTFHIDGSGNMTGNIPVKQIDYANKNNIQAVAMISNAFDGEIAKNMLENPSNRQRLINNIINSLKNNNYKGVNIDIEGIYSYDRNYFTTFMKELYTTLNTQGFEVGISVPAKTIDRPSDNWSGAYDYSQLSNYADEIILMTYDEHWFGGSSGPIASIDWVEKVVNYAVTVIPKEKIMLGMAAYAYDWPSNGEKAKSYSINQALNIASEYGAAVKFDSTSKSPYFNYTDSSGVYHSVWLENSTSIGYKLDLVNKYDLSGVAMWRLGLESPDFWTTIGSKLNK
ncbi:cell wall-binding repeat-containing protein [Clostridium sp. DJ247]|uniref:cell wall-binding repeat-containing protein n=1 Tax=Clostridium sp. DJ247 TaxID=2726188 RepID=UPI001629CEDB|nr:cell wall-binding repeat-containing protein [Clostridium sp. DJ247]MBC2581629.1 glycoside hydrolase family 18 [Clostridium sp. DJ247]